MPFQLLGRAQRGLARAPVPRAPTVQAQNRQIRSGASVAERREGEKVPFETWAVL